ncbi:MAG: thiamine pyrophosphate-requiring protein [Deltaproteobacteria bacterium]|nr:thiamine pyrophosphate-requiring protein [Deltaproteobacteria bacterium]
MSLKKENSMIEVNAENTAQAFLDLLALRGIEYFFGNAGTDFASIVDAFSRRKAEGKTLPVPVTVPHEIPLVSMAQGYYLYTGKIQAAMVHVGVGTANALGSIMTGKRSRIPLLFFAGRTPVTEDGHPASRSSFVHWAQECYDQAGMIREFVNWDYELRFPSQLEEVIDRALVMALSEPCGPVYLTLPREALYSSFDKKSFNSRLKYDLPTFYPDPDKIKKVAELIHNSENPIIITSSYGKRAEHVETLIELAEAGGIGVISFNPEYMNFPAVHYCHQGFTPDPLLSDVDLVICLESDVPWYPASIKPNDSAFIVNIGIDPLYSKYPVRSYPSDITLNGDPCITLKGIIKELSGINKIKETILEDRRNRLRKSHDALFHDLYSKAENLSGDTPLNQGFVSSRVNSIIDNNTIVVNEYDNQMIWQKNISPGHYFGVSHAGYLGWAVGAALGMKMAAPEKTVITTVGDGSYMFSVPSACHYVSKAYDLPILVIIYNNQSWEAVRQATKGIHPDGWAAKDSGMPLTELRPSPDYELICTAFGGYGEKVERPEDLEGALKRALAAVNKEKRQACLNVVCG